MNSTRGVSAGVTTSRSSARNRAEEDGAGSGTPITCQAPVPMRFRSTIAPSTRITSSTSRCGSVARSGMVIDL